MLFHEFREDLVLALELLLQEDDPPVLGVTGASGPGFIVDPENWTTG